MPTFDNIKNLADGPTTEEGQGLLNSNGVSANSTVATNTSSNLNTSQSSASQTNINTDQQTSDVKIYLNKDIYGPVSLAGSLSDSSRNKTLDTESLYISSDLLCEGPIEGLVDPDGSTLNYFLLEIKKLIF